MPITNVTAIIIYNWKITSTWQMLKKEIWRSNDFNVQTFKESMYMKTMFILVYFSIMQMNIQKLFMTTGSHSSPKNHHQSCMPFMMWMKKNISGCLWYVGLLFLLCLVCCWNSAIILPLLLTASICFLRIFVIFQYGFMSMIDYLHIYNIGIAPCLR